MGRRTGIPLLGRDGKKIFASKGAFVLKEVSGGFQVRSDTDNAMGDLTVGALTTQSGLTNTGSTKVGSSGAVVTQIAIITENINFGASLSGIQTHTIDTAVTTGNSGFIGSGDYIIPLTQPAESGFTLLPAVAASTNTVSLRAVTTVAINPAAADFKLMILRSTA